MSITKVTMVEKPASPKESVPVVDESQPTGVKLNSDQPAPPNPLSLEGTPATPETPQTPEAPVVTPEAPKETPGLSDTEIASFEQEVVTTGQLSDASLEALKSRGIPEAFAVKYVEGQKALAAQRTQALLAPIGGEEAFTQVKAWAISNLSVAEKNSFQKTLESGSDADISTALAGIHARYKAAVGNTPQQIRGQATGTGPTPFRDVSEMVAVMNDPRYHTSQAFRDDVQKRIAVSPNI